MFFVTLGPLHCFWCKDLQRPTVDQVDMFGPLRLRSRSRLYGNRLVAIEFFSWWKWALEGRSLEKSVALSEHMGEGSTVM